MSVEIFDSSRIAAEHEARRARTSELRQAYNEVCLLVVNTGTHMKAAAATEIAAVLIDPAFHVDTTKTIISPSKKDEPIMPKASQVARFKAETARQEFIEAKVPDHQYFLEQLDIALKHNAGDQLIKELLACIVFVGGDINASVLDPKTGLLLPSHKKERQFGNELPEEEYIKIRQELYDTYVSPPFNQSRVIWDASTSTINGTDHEFGDLIEVISKPIEPELLEIYLAMALVDGKILRSNTHLAAFEMLRESGKIISTSKLPSSLARQGYVLADFRQAPKDTELDAIHKTINSNTPIYIP